MICIVIPFSCLLLAEIESMDALDAMRHMTTEAYITTAVQEIEATGDIRTHPLSSTVSGRSVWTRVPMICADWVVSQASKDRKNEDIVVIASLMQLFFDRITAYVVLPHATNRTYVSYFYKKLTLANISRHLIRDLRRHLTESKQSQIATRMRNDELQLSYSQSPVNIPLSAVHELASLLWRIIVPINSTANIGSLASDTEFMQDRNRVCAALCLLELCTGGRSEDTVSTSIIEPTDDDLSGRAMISATNISKQKSLQSRAQAQFKLQQGRDASKDDMKLLTAIENGLTDLTIKKPFFSDYFTPAFISSCVNANFHGIVDCEKATSACLIMDMLCACRLAIFREYARASTDVQSKIITLHNGETRELLYTRLHHQNIDITTHSQLFKRGMRDVLSRLRFKLHSLLERKLFGDAKKTHQLRKLYVAVAYKYYSDNTMKETAFAMQVLGHAHLNVALNYTAVRVTESGNTYDEMSTRRRLSMAEFSINELKAQLLDLQAKYTGRDRVGFKKPDGSSVYISKRKRSRSTSSSDSFKSRIDKARNIKLELEKHGVKVNTYNIRKLGGHILTSELSQI